MVMNHTNIKKGTKDQRNRRYDFVTILIEWELIGMFH